MCLLSPSDKGGYGRDSDDGTALRCLFYHLIRNSFGDVEAAIEVDFLYPLPQPVRHVEERVKGADTCV